jgi:hypothetical protein
VYCTRAFSQRCPHKCHPHTRARARSIRAVAALSQRVHELDDQLGRARSALTTAETRVAASEDRARRLGAGLDGLRRQANMVAGELTSNGSADGGRGSGGGSGGSYSSGKDVDNGGGGPRQSSYGNSVDLVGGVGTDMAGRGRTSVGGADGTWRSREFGGGAASSSGAVGVAHRAATAATPWDAAAPRSTAATSDALSESLARLLKSVSTPPRNALR